MHIPYKNSKIYLHLGFAILWTITSIAIAIIDWPYLSFEDYVWFGFAIAYWVLFYNNRYLHYLQVKNGRIRRNTFPRRSMALDEIIRVHNNWDEFILFTRTSKMKIKLEVVPDHVIPELDSYLTKLRARTRKSLQEQKPAAVVEGSLGPSI